MSGVGTERRAPSFRRRTFAVRRRRSHPLIALGVPLIRALLLVTPVVALGAWLLTATAFNLDGVTVNGAERIGETWVQEVLAPLHGRNLVKLPLRDVRERLEPNPWIRTVALRKELPSRLRVHVVEHQPAALLRDGDQLLYLSEEGAVITPYTADAEGRFLVVNYVGGPWQESDHTAGARTRPELARALSVGRTLEVNELPWAGRLTRIEILGQEDYRLWLDALPFPVLVRAATAEPKIVLLERLLPAVLGRYPRLQSVDLRFSNRIVLRPAVESRPPQVPTGFNPAAIPTGT